ncbi:MAG: glycoside hydrolase [Clostridiales bacterium]|nr:glycoside hydrolase [Clostridiales bacterium]
MGTRFQYSGFSLEVEEPVVVGQGESYEKLGWGPWQFPSLSMTDRGHVLCTWATGEDSIEGYEDSVGDGVFIGAVSEDGGKTWRGRTREDRAVGTPMQNGREYIKPAAKNAYPVSWLDRYAPAYSSPDGGLKLYRADEIPEYPRTCPAKEYDPATGETTEFTSRVNWPHAAVTVLRSRDRELVYPLDSLMGIMGQLVPAEDGNLLFATYGHGFSARTGELVMGDKYKTYVFRSDDCGRTWDWISEVVTTPEYCPSDRDAEGFCEPNLARMPDGSWVMLLRTGSGCPSWLVRSTDGCHTWSKPVILDGCGVLPQLRVLGCGVSLAGYGRPGVYLRASSDPSGLRWEEPVDLQVEHSCCYTAILPLDDTTALFGYSDFRYPGPDGRPLKTILTRRVTVER